MIKLDYAAAPEAASIGRVRERYQMFLGGEFVDGHGPDLVSVNPSDETTLSTVSSASADDVDTAVRLARTAYEDVWSRLSGLERGKYLFRIARGIAERSRELAVLESLDNGKPIKETRDFDVPAAAQYFFSYAGWADKLQHLGYGPSPSALGVAGLPAGVVNVLPGAGDIGAALVGHPGIDKVAFTGSTAVGKRIQTELAGTGRRLTLELGGKGANIVFDDAAVDQAVEGVVNGIFFNQGQVCCAGSRLLVQESVAEEFLDRLRARVETLRVGHALDKNTDVGAVNSRAQLDKITALTQSGVDEGAQRWVSPCPVPETGLYVAPTILTDASPSMRVSREEIFGPVLTTLTFRTPEEAIAKANNTPYGLSAGVWTDKGSRAMAVASALRAGVVWNNTFNRFDPAAAFGGYGESGFGREGGPYGLAAYLDTDDEGVL